MVEFERQRIKCYRCKIVNYRKDLRLMIWEDYDEKGGWVNDGLYCRPCIDAIESFMNGD